MTGSTRAAADRRGHYPCRRAPARVVSRRQPRSGPFSRLLPDCERCMNRICAEPIALGSTARPVRGFPDGTPAGLRAAHGRGARGPPHPALVHRRARPAQVVRHLPRRARERLRGGHALRRLGHRRASAGCRRATCSPGPTPTRFEMLPWARRRRRRRPGCSATSRTSTARPSRATPARCCKRNLDKARERGFTFYRRPRDGVLLLRRRRPDARRPSRSTPASYFDLTTADVASDLRKRTILTLEAMGIPVEYSFHEDAPEPARDRPALHRRAHDGRQRHDVPARRAGGRPGAGRVRHVHAQAARRRAGLGHAHPPLAVRGRRQRLPRPGRRVRPVEGRPAASSPACCATPARSPRSPTSGSTPTSGSSSATRRRSTSRWARNNRSALVRRAADQAGQGRLDPHRVPRARPGVQPLPRLLGDAGRRPEGHRGGLRAPARGHRPTSSR